MKKFYGDYKIKISQVINASKRTFWGLLKISLRTWPNSTVRNFSAFHPDSDCTPALFAFAGANLGRFPAIFSALYCGGRISPVALVQLPQTHHVVHQIHHADLEPSA